MANNDVGNVEGWKSRTQYICSQKCESWVHKSIALFAETMAAVGFIKWHKKYESNHKRNNSVDFPTLINLATLLSVLVAVFGLILGIRTYKRQTNAQVFLEYTGRYERIMESFPADALGARLSADADPPAQSTALTLATLRYLNLCSEEFYLWKKGYLSLDVWRIWEDELKRTLKSKLVRREWNQLKTEFRSYGDFVEFVDAVQRDAT